MPFKEQMLVLLVSILFKEAAQVFVKRFHTFDHVVHITEREKREERDRDNRRVDETKMTHIIMPSM